MKSHLLRSSRSTSNFSPAITSALLLIAAAFAEVATAQGAVGDVFVADNGAQRIYQYTPPNLDGIFTNAVSFPRGLAFDSAGNLYEADNGSGSIFKFTPAGVKSTFASGFIGVSDLAFDKDGNLYASDPNTGGTNGAIIKITPSGVKSTFASGLRLPRGLAFDSAGNLYVAEQGSNQGDSTILKFTPSGVMSTFDVVGFNHKLQGLAFDSTGNFLYSADAVPKPLIRKYDVAGRSATIFTTNIPQPADLAVDSANNVYVTDSTGAVYMFAPNGTRTTLSSGLSAPLGIAIMPGATVPAQLLNISTRMKVLSGDNALIGGFIVTGTDPKKVGIRAIGPSLPISGVLADPTLELHDGSGAVIAYNDDWKINDATGRSQEADVRATGIPPTNDLESIIVITLPANNATYTAVMRGRSNTTGINITGIGLVEAYDLSQPAKSQLANISTRGFVDTGDNVMIGGFISGNGTGSDRVVVRAIGPSLPVSGALQDPVLELHNSSGTTIASNDDWQSDPNAAQVQAAGVAPKDTRESALYMVVPPAAYTAIVRGKNNTTGIGLVEVYNLQ